MSKACKQELQNFLEKPAQKDCKVVVAPDFFLDRFIDFPWDNSKF